MLRSELYLMLILIVTATLERLKSKLHRDKILQLKQFT
jgi:hypothetical protein